MNLKETTMLCPSCKSELSRGEDKRLETLNEHLFDPNGTPSLKASYFCPNNECIASNKGIIWNDDGEAYNTCGKDIPWIDNNDAPFGSFQRKMNVEIYKKDEDRLLFKFPCWPLKNWKCYSKWQYGSNEDGDILSRRLRLEWVRPDGCIHVWGYRMLLFSTKGTYRAWKELRKNPEVLWYKDSLKETVKQNTFRSNEWWRHVNSFVARMALKTLKDI